MKYKNCNRHVRRLLVNEKEYIICSRNKIVYSRINEVMTIWEGSSYDFVFHFTNIFDLPERLTESPSISISSSGESQNFWHDPASRLATCSQVINIHKGGLRTCCPRLIQSSMLLSIVCSVFI